MEPPPDLADPEAWSGLVCAANPAALLVSISIRMGLELRHRITAEDILQETLLKAWAARATFAWEDTPSFRRWLLRIADNCIADHRDRERADKRDHRRVAALRIGVKDASSEDGGSGAFEPWGSTTPSRLASEQERAQRMRAALESLPDDVREVVRLRLFDERTLEEIAEDLGLGTSAVRHRLRKGAELYSRLIGMDSMRAPSPPPRSSP